MPRLYRPPIPVEVKCRVALHQLGEMFVDHVIDDNRGHLGGLLEQKLTVLAEILGCERPQLRLDHNPALGLRKKRRTGKHVIVGGEVIEVIEVVKYTPDANDPAHLIYRSHHAHHIKTNVRGDGAQFSDTTLMKRERRRVKKAAKAKLVSGIKLRGRLAKLTTSRPIPKRVNPWGPKGSRKIRNGPWRPAPRS